jgi:hypothetical protein
LQTLAPDNEDFKLGIIKARKTITNSLPPDVFKVQYFSALGIKGLPIQRRHLKASLSMNEQNIAIIYPSISQLLSVATNVIGYKQTTVNSMTSYTLPIVLPNFVPYRKLLITEVCDVMHYNEKMDQTGLPAKKFFFMFSAISSHKKNLTTPICTIF